ncbi:MAG: phage tail assembly protein [Achromobacter sp.]|uniref:phage tail assembly protein n=1 Tax=Achromobacter sp. TaxID=134375 RepID=UPI0012C0B3CA|nr:phage tail assembly protein [Achromobacter sp.]MPS80922.1 phage tail assembly protein [Achromobacter sp.]
MTDTTTPNALSQGTSQPAAVIDTDNVKSVDLDEPIKRSSGEIKRVLIRKPNAGALRGVTLMALVQVDVQALRTVLPRVCDPILTPAEINELDPADLLTVGATLASFFMSKAERQAIQTP